MNTPAAAIAPLPETPPPHAPGRQRPPDPPRPRRRLLRWLMLFVGAALLLGAAALFWALGTAGGRDTLLFRIVAMLPPGSLSWESADGVISGPLVLHGVHYRQADGLDFRAERVLLDPDLLPVLGRRLQLDRMEVDGARLQLPPEEDAPFELPSWPDSLPRLPMPLDLRATTLVVDGLDVQRDGDPVIAIETLTATGVHLVDDGFALEQATLASDRGRITLRGDYRPARDFRSDLAATLTLPAADGVQPATLQLALQGDLDALKLDVAGNAPGRIGVIATIDDGAGDAPAWTLQALADGVDPSLFATPARADVEAGAGGAAADASEDVALWRVELDARGTGGDAELHGELAQGDWQASVLPSKLHLADGVLRAEPLRLRLPEGELELTGTLQVEGDNARFDARLASDALRLQPAAGEAGALPVEIGGHADVAGTVDAWTLQLDADARRGDEQATLRARGDGDRTQLRLAELQARTPGGTLDGSGLYRWTPQPQFELQARLAGFDPGYFLPDYPGAVVGRLRVQASRGDDGRWRGDGEITELGGELRGRAVAGRAQADWDGRRGHGDVDLRVGASVLRGQGEFGDRYDLRLAAAPLQLDDLLAGAAGRVDGTLALRGPADAADIDADLSGTGLGWAGDSADQISLVGRLPARGDGGSIEFRGSGVDVAGIAVDELTLVARGSQKALQLRGGARSDAGMLALEADLARAGGGWSGRLQQLQLQPAEGASLALEAPAGFAFAGDAWQLERACLSVVEAGGRLCVAAEPDHIDIDGEAIPLALAQPWLPDDTGVAMQAFGTLDAQARLRRGGNGRWSGNIDATSDEGGLRVAENLTRDAFGYRDLVLHATVAAGAVDGTLQARLAVDGRVEARLQAGAGDDGALAGELHLDVRDLTWLELFSEDLAAPVGTLQGTLLVAGTRAAPQLSGEAQLAGFASELPALGVKLHDGDFDLVGDADGSLRLTGQVTSGDGTLQLDGSLDVDDPESPLVLTLKGSQVTLASTAELYAIADPDITLRWLADRLEVRGSLTVPEARIDLEALDSSVATSPDVVVVDPLEDDQSRGKPLDLQFQVTLGDDVALKGFGLDGRIAGALTLQEKPGRRAIASGTLEVTGNYRAYGQALEIRHARLGYADSPYDDPTLDIRAERDFDTATVGVQVRGSARRPQTTVVSSPAMETSEALSWLVFGRPLSSTTSGEGQQLGGAALALGAGGNLVAQQLGAKLGFDEAGVADSRNLGGAAFTVGKYVSPRLFLSYGVSLIGTGQVVTLKYLLTRDFDISIESGNENAASINWRREK